jgi:aspartyl-tRNA(Asn)/glutamyl-tRNA(Gln) amidotransferase subunit B
MGINDIAINALIVHRDVSTFLKNALALGINHVISANLLTGDVLSHLNKHNITIDKTKLSEDNFCELVQLIDKGDISSKMGKEVLQDLMVCGGSVTSILNQKGMKQINDLDTIRSLINNVLTINQNVVADYKNGNERALKYLVGQIMKESKGQANPTILNQVLTEELNKFNV